MTEKPRSDFSRVVLAVLAAYDMRQDDLAEAMGLTQPQISNKLRGRTPWTEADIATASRFLDPLPQQLYDLLRRSPARSLTVAYPSRPASDNDDGGVAA